MPVGRAEWEAGLWNLGKTLQRQVFNVLLIQNLPILNDRPIHSIDIIWKKGKRIKKKKTSVEN